MTPRFTELAHARDFAAYAEHVSGAPFNIYNARTAYVVRPQGEVPFVWRLANAWGYLMAERVPRNGM